MSRILVLAVYPTTSAVTRLRAEQFRPYFKERGADLHIWTFLGGEDLERLYESGYLVRAQILARGLLRTLRLPRLAARSDLVIVLREAMPFRTAIIEKVIGRFRPLVWDVDDAIWQPYRSHFFPWMPPWVRKSPSKFIGICSIATQVWAASDELAGWCRRLSPAVRVVPTVVEVPKSRPERDRGNVLGWIGAPSTGKFLAQILPALGQIDPVPRLVVVGSDLPDLPKLPVEKMKWSLQAEERALQSMSVGLYPIDRNHPLAEGKAGLKAILYMSRGIPPVVTPTRTNAEIVRPEVDGLHAETLQEWTRQTQRLLNDQGLWERCSKSAHAHVLAGYSVAVWGPRVAGYAEEIVFAGGRVEILRPPAPAAAAPPLVSVVMPVYNGIAHLDESIGSILSQSFERFELLILDDGSTDGTLRRLREWEAMDSRVRVFESTENLGVVASSNLVASKAGTALIARMDADDVSHPDRLRRQWEIFQAHPEAQIVGTLWDGIDGSGHTVRPRDRWRLAYPSRLAPFAHGSVMFRADSFHKLGGYRAECRYWEDLDLYFRMQALGRVVAIPETLYHYRFHTLSTRAATPPEQLIDSIALMRQCRQARAEGKDYEAILRSHVPIGGERVPPAVLNSITSARLWAGHSPDTIRLLMSRGELSWDRSTVVAVAMAVWGTLSPPSLRFFLRRLIQLRDLLAGRWVRGKDVLDWRIH